MPNMILRFYGRFLWAEPCTAGKPEGRVDVVAVNPAFNPDIAADPHRFVMSAPRLAVSTAGTRPPAVNVMASSPDPAVSEHLVWDLNAQEVSINPTDRFQWDPSEADLLDLNALAGGQPNGATKLIAHEDAMRVASGVVRLTGGTAAPKALPKPDGTRVEFATMSGNRQTVRLKRSDLPAADFVEVTIEVGESLVVEFSRQSAQPRSVVVISPSYDVPGAKEPVQTIVNFSNLCSSVRGRSDAEFAAFYDMLSDPPAVFARVIPTHDDKDPSILGIRFDCYLGARVRFEA